MGHHLRGGECAPEAGELQGQAAAVQARLKVQTQRDLLMDQMPRQGLKGRLALPKAQAHFLPVFRLSGKQTTPSSPGTGPNRLGFKCPPNNPPNLSPAFLVCEMGQQSPSRPAHGRHGLLLAVTMLYQNCPLAGWPEHRTKTSRTSVSGHLSWPRSRPGPVGCAPSSHLPLCLLGSDGWS